MSVTHLELGSGERQVLDKQQSELSSVKKKNKKHLVSLTASFVSSPLLAFPCNVCFT